MNKESSNKIKNVNLILSLFVVFSHAFNLNYYDLNHNGLTYNLEKYTIIFFQVAVPLFFSISAFLFYYNYEKNSLLEKWKRRIKTILIPYIIWNIIGFLFFQIIGLFPGISSNYGGEIDKLSFINFVYAIITNKYNGVTWFMGLLLFFFLISPFIFKSMKNKKVSLVLLFLFFALSVYGNYIENKILHNFIYFYIGVYFAKHNKELVLKRYNNKTKSVSFIMTILITIFDRKFNLKSSLLFYAFEDCAFIVLFWIFFDWLAEKNFGKLTKTSFLIYVSHEMILEPIEKIIFIVLDNCELGAFIDYVFAPMITVAIIYLLYSVLSKFPKIKSVLLGGR